jgi:hypothetical protein
MRLSCRLKITMKLLILYELKYQEAGNRYRICPGGEIGRRKGLKIPRRKLRAGSSPAPGTT